MRTYEADENFDMKICKKEQHFVIILLFDRHKRYRNSYSIISIWFTP